jgi:hypothetical protein
VIFKMKILQKVGAVVAAVGGALTLTGAVFAQTPTVTTPSAEAQQLLVNGVASIQATLFSIAGVIWPYVLGVLLFFLVIRFGMSFFHHR